MYTFLCIKTFYFYFLNIIIFFKDRVLPSKNDIVSFEFCYSVGFQMNSSFGLFSTLNNVVVRWRFNNDNFIL